MSEKYRSMYTLRLEDLMMLGYYVLFPLQYTNALNLPESHNNVAFVQNIINFMIFHLEFSHRFTKDHVILSLQMCRRFLHNRIYLNMHLNASIDFADNSFRIHGLFIFPGDFEAGKRRNEGKWMSAGRLFLGGFGAGMSGAVLGVTTGVLATSHWPAWLWALAGSAVVSALGWSLLVRRQE